MSLGALGQSKEFVAGRGASGGRWRKHGGRGEDLGLLVPKGTLVLGVLETGEPVLLDDLIREGQRVVVARGGEGGKGNIHFATPSNQAPTMATRGRLGEQRRITLEHKLLTDICIVGMANSGKSSLLRAMTGAPVQVADYPFTTRQPQMGVIQGRRRDLIVTELPGLMEGANAGKGLGSGFLRHMERTVVAVYLLDAGSPKLAEDLEVLEKEISLHGKGLSGKRRLLVLNKVDVPGAGPHVAALWDSLTRGGVPVLRVSAASGEGVPELIEVATRMVEQAAGEGLAGGETPVAVFRPRPKG